MSSVLSSTDFGYRPDAARARKLDQIVREKLAKSLLALGQALDDAGTAKSELLFPISERARSAPLRPAVFAYYTDLVDAVRREQDDRIRDRLKLLSDPLLMTAVDRRVVNFAAAPLGKELSELYLSIFDDNMDLPLGFRSVDDAEFRFGNEAVAGGIELLEKCCPEMAGEVHALINEIILSTNRGVAPPPGVQELCNFGSGTTFYLWGAAFIDPMLEGRVGMAEALVHEAGHCMLLALTNAKNVVKNDRSERYFSPLRTDGRPMEGLVHATYVLGRMCMFFEKILKDDEITAEERAYTIQRHKKMQLALRYTSQTVRQHAIFTELGEQAMQGCLATVSDRLQ